ncbi:MAG TPA: CCA tRNA nucleotidyltransferase [Gemmatimonadaceae bacterium]|jgi:tRNA nucleotidyltransferase (CCA-adding enzyme)|nr:CCA tRNA nucleotidyltransferase [Gemmatimonadaceae bacterium]
MTRRLKPPPAVREIAARLERAGHETWCVGGAIRDALLGVDNLDWDLATAATPQQVRRLFRRTVPVGMEFGTVGVLDDAGVLHEVTTFRRDVRTDGRHAEVEFGASLDDDLARRDFTINAIAYGASSGELHDPFGGQQDLASGIVRAVGDPAARLAEDRLRALRAIRFAARFGFHIEPATWQAIADSAPHMGRLSPERVKQELEKTMEQVEHPSKALALWRTSGVLGTLVPPLAQLDAEAFAEASLAVDCVPRPSGGPHGARRRRLRLAALVSALPPEQVAPTLRELRFSNADVRVLAGLAELWDTLAVPMARALEAGQPAPADVRRWVARAGRTRIADFLRVAAARWAARRSLGQPAPDVLAVRRLYGLALRAAYRDPVDLGALAVGGDDLRSAGVSPGPRMAHILHGLLEWVLEDPRRNTVIELLARARQLDSTLPPGSAPGK